MISLQPCHLTEPSALSGACRSRRAASYGRIDVLFNKTPPMAYFKLARRHHQRGMETAICGKKIDLVFFFSTRAGMGRI